MMHDTELNKPLHHQQQEHAAAGSTMEMASMNKIAAQQQHQQQQHPLDAEPVVVETVESDDDMPPPIEDEPLLDNLERNVAMIVHMALAFFTVLFIVAIIMTMVLVSQFNVLLMGIVGLLIAIVCGFVIVLDKAMRHHPDWKPVRSRLQKISKMATAAIVKEVRYFQQDWMEHLMLTDGTVESPKSDDDDLMGGNENGTGIFVDGDDAANKDGKEKKKKKSKSIMFQFVKPFLKIRRLRRNKKNKKEDADDAKAAAATQYIPPIV